MSAYTPGDSSYPHHPAPRHLLQQQQQQQQHQQHQQHHQQPQHQLQPYHFEPPPPQIQHQQHQQQVHQQQLLYDHNGHNGHIGDAQQAPASATPTNGDGQGPAPVKGNRLRKACDSCSARKVKCDEATPCKACVGLDIPCTTNRPSRRRGPPNKHAEALKKRKLDDSQDGMGDFSSPTSPNNVAATLASFSSHAVLNAESICPIDTLQLLIDDFFTYIHPLAPFPHEPSFRDAFRKREDLRNPLFLALLASMISALVASFPRKPRLHLKAQHREHLFTSSLALVSRCRKVAVQARGPGNLEREPTIYEAVTSYFLGLAAAYTHQWKSCRLYFGETLTISRVLGAHKSSSYGLIAGGASPGGAGEFIGQPEPVDFIKQEVARRIFWVMIVGIRSLQQHGAIIGELFIPPPTPNDPYPPYPMEIDDQFIYADHYDPQPLGIISRMTGFNVGIKIYMSLTPLATLEMCYGINEVFDWNRQKKVLEDCLRTVKGVLDNLPMDLQLRPSSQPGEFEAADRQYFPGMTGYSGIGTNGNELNQWENESRRKLQFEIQKANIYVSQLGTRSYIVEKYGTLQETFDRIRASTGGEAQLNSPGAVGSGLDRIMAHNGSTGSYEEIETNVAVEREIIVKDLLRVLTSISQVNMEPSGASFINKVRQIASTLIGQPSGRKGPFALKSEAYLGKFIDVLMRLERMSPAPYPKTEGGASLDEDEEEELRSWADLRDFQIKFAQSGGFFGDG